MPILRPGTYGRRVLSRLTLLAVLVLASGCLKKAAYLPNEHGGYTLMTKAGSMEEAAVRFRRTATDVCGTQAYSLTNPVVIASGSGLLGSAIHVQSELTCR